VVSHAYGRKTGSEIPVYGPKARWFEFWFDLEPRAYYGSKPTLSLYRALVKLTWFSHKYLGIRVIDRPYKYDYLKQNIVKVASKVLGILGLRPHRRSHMSYQVGELIRAETEHFRATAPLSRRRPEPKEQAKVLTDEDHDRNLRKFLADQYETERAAAKAADEHNEVLLKELLSLRESETAKAVSAIEADREAWEVSRSSGGALDQTRYPYNSIVRYYPSYDARSTYELPHRYAILNNWLIAQPKTKSRVPWCTKSRAKAPHQKDLMVIVSR